MRKWIAALLAAVVLMAGAVPALAAQKWWTPGYDSFDIEGNSGHILRDLKLKTSLLNPAQKTFMEEWLTSDKAILVFRWFNGKTDGFYDFMILDGYTGAASLLYSSSTGFTFRGAWRSVSFDIADGTPSGVRVDSGSSYTMPDTSSRGLGALIASNVDFDPSLNDWYMNFEKVYLYDDDGLFQSEQPDPPEPSEPEPSEPDVPVVPPSKPEVPAIKDEYIPYDTTRWNGFFDWVSSAIGNGTNVGLKVFAFLLSIIVVIRVVKQYSH